MEAHKLQPHFVESFFVEAFKSVGGRMHLRENGRYEITFVPYVVRNRDMQIGFGQPVPQKYERICFDKEACNIQGQAPADLICPGHPLLEATLDLVLERNSDVMKRGAVFIDEEDYGTDARLLFYIEDAIQDGMILPNGSKRVISKNIHFVELKEDGTAKNAGYAPYLDYRAAAKEEQSVLGEYIEKQDWLMYGVEDRALQYAVSEIMPKHFSEVKTRKQKMLDKTVKAVRERLTAEIQYWDFRAADLKQKEMAGKTNARLNSDNAYKRAEELEARMQKRLDELEKEKMISPMPPVVTGGALIIPKGLLYKLTGKPLLGTFGHHDLKAVEHAAMKAVMDIEMSLGFCPKDVSKENCGYDVESMIPEELRDGSAILRFIEVKGRAKGAKTVTVTKNEILTARTKENNFILAIVEVDGDRTRTIYLKKPFKETLGFAVTSINYNIVDLVRQGEIIYES